MNNQNPRKSHSSLRSSNNSVVFKMTAARQVPDRIQFDAVGKDFRDDGGARFRRKFDRALRSAAREIVVNVRSEGPLTSGALGVLLKARADAVKAGSRFVVRPACGETAGFLKEIGLAKVLGVAA